MNDLSYSEINEDVLQATSPPRRLYWIVMLILLGGIGAMFLGWMALCFFGMGITGLNTPVGWAVFITNFVFWVGIAHSGTLISAVLYLTRAKWRNAVSRSAEAMTIFAVMTAGLFPLIHLGRLWAAYYILPYPSQRQLWPNFMSPLVWDVLAVTTYFTVSLIFWYIGMVPDLGAARDRAESRFGPDAPRTQFYRAIALGWSGTGSQWRHYGRSYMFFAALATPLVVSVHSVVSWDFAMSLLPGWHSTIFPPYFVAGAIHSGLAMVLTILIPMRKWLKLERLITPHHLEMVGKTIIATTLIIGYSYGVEHYITWFSGDIFEIQFSEWRTFSGTPGLYWSLILFNVLIPLLLVFRRVRTNITALFIISIVINIGMWLERFVIIFVSLSHDFLPHAWGTYMAQPVEIIITIGSFLWFFMWFLLFAKFLPTVPIEEVKEEVAEEKLTGMKKTIREVTRTQPQGEGVGVVGVYHEVEPMMRALQKLLDAGYRKLETFTPSKIEEVHQMLGEETSPVRRWTLAGGLLGLSGGFALALYTASVNGLYVGGKSPLSIIPYCIVGFEMTILFGAIGNLLGLLRHARLGPPKTARGYDRCFSGGCFGILVECQPQEKSHIREILGDAERLDEIR